MSSDTAYGVATDVRFRAVGIGLVIRSMCMGCQKSRPAVGGKGKPGVRWRCAHCVAEKGAKS